MSGRGGKQEQASLDLLGADLDRLDWSGVQGVGGHAGWLGDISIQYRPMWDTKRRAISTFVAIPTSYAESRMATGRQNVLPDVDSAARLALDIYMLQKASRDLAATLAENGRALVCVQVDFETLANVADRVEYMSHWAPIAEETRKHLILELIGLPDGIAASRLFELAGMVKRQCRAVIAQVLPGFQLFASLREAGISVAGIEMTGRPADETTVIGRLQRFADQAGKAGLNSYLHGTPSLSLTVAAMAAGFTYIDGDTVASPSDGLQLVRRFGIEDLYRRVLMRPA